MPALAHDPQMLRTAVAWSEWIDAHTLVATLPNGWTWEIFDAVIDEVAGGGITHPGLHSSGGATNFLLVDFTSEPCFPGEGAAEHIPRALMLLPECFRFVVLVGLHETFSDSFLSFSMVFQLRDMVIPVETLADALDLTEVLH